MLSPTNFHSHMRESHQRFLRLNCPLIRSIILGYDPKKRAEDSKKTATLSRYFGFAEEREAWKIGRNLDNSWCCWCKLSEGDIELEPEIMGFMAKSQKPTMFPTKEELMKAGRRDLVEAIKKKGGWYSLGWDEENEVDNAEKAMDFDIADLQRSTGNYKESASLKELCDNSFSMYEKEEDISSDLLSDSRSLNCMHLTASLLQGRSLEIRADGDAGIEGILRRLEKRRNSDVGINLGKNRYQAHAKDRHFNTSLYVGSVAFTTVKARTDLGENGGLLAGFHHKGILNVSDGKISSNIEPETWRAWSNRRAGFHYTEFAAAEISFSKNRVVIDKENYHDGITLTAEEYAVDWEKHRGLDHNQIRTRLRHLESELTTALHSLRSKREECIAEEVTGSSGDLQKLSDAWEFQENEFMSAQRRLRSIKTKLAILEGKMALAIIDAQKKVEVKQKQIDSACEALQLLRTTCIVWPNSASEVLVAGSFDGWTTQRKMEKSKTGIFSVYLKLYPGRYEIKFIVDGTWKVDPLRPIVNDNGYENNLFIVT